MSKTTHIICILDKSGSMSSLALEVVSNFNKFLTKQQSIKGKAKLTLVLFDDDYEVIYDQVKLKDVKPLTDEYQIGGMTAMNDAIGKTLSKLSNKEKAIVFIHTDGYENASKEYSASEVKKLIDSKKNWDFNFVGADIDAKQVSSSLGITKSMKINKNARGVQMSYDTFSDVTVAYRSS